MQTIERQLERVFLGALDPRCQTSQVVCPLVEVSVVEVILFLEQSFGYRDHEVNRQFFLRTNRGLQRVTPCGIYAGGAFEL